MPRGTVDVPTGLPESILALRNRARRVRRLADGVAHERDVVNNLRDYANELDLKANELERGPREGPLPTGREA